MGTRPQLTRVPNAHARPLLSRVAPIVIALAYTKLLLNTDTPLPFSL